MIDNLILLRIFTLAASLLLAGCYSHLNQHAATEPGSADYDIDRVVDGIVYTPPYWPQPLQADLYLPQKNGPHPVVLTIHGGGWANRNRDDMAGISRKLARHGYAVFNVSYRFAPYYTYPAQLHDIYQALAWIDKNAPTYNLDRNRLNVWGYSSGAHLAALTASFDNDALPVSERNRLSSIRAVVAGGIPSDLRKYSGSPIVMRFMGGDRDEMPGRYAEASPAYHISADDPPVFLYHGKLDFLVATDQATDYYKALLAAGIQAELYLHNWREHMTMFVFGGHAENRAIQFLNRKNGTAARQTARLN
ncbi:MAG: alpha/beta hydrolase [Gammaproteobacteria bacterium]|nr:MAG: alpha/beta hydrolase [Gammaproteobacteria bacterium]